MIQTPENDAVQGGQRGSEAKGENKTSMSKES